MLTSQWNYEHVAAYLAFQHNARAHLAQHAGGTVTLQWGFPLTAEQFRLDTLKALHRRINLKAGIPADGGAGRKFESDYQISMRRDRDHVHDRMTRRIRVYQFETPEIRRRFGHLLSRYDD